MRCGLLGESTGGRRPNESGMAGRLYRPRPPGSIEAAATLPAMTDALAGDPAGAPAAPRAIDPAAPQYNATLVDREDQHESLGFFRVRFDGEPTPFEPGQ